MIEEMTDDFIATLKRVRAEQNLTQQDLARALGVSRAAIGQWERGQTAPTFANMKALADLFNFADKLVEEKPGRKRDGLRFWRIITAGNTLKDDIHSIPVTHWCIGVMGLVEKSASYKIDYLARPQILEDQHDAYGIAIGTDAVSPRFEVGETIYVSPSDEPSAGEYGVFTYVGADNTTIVSNIRRLVFSGEDSVQLQRVKDNEVVTIMRSSLKSAHRIVPWNELLQVLKDDDKRR